MTKKGRLAAGQTILVPTAAVASAAQDVPDPSIERYGKPASARIVVHVVKHGETINGIARRYHTQPARIRELNHLRRNMIYPGQQLVVKRSGGAASTKRSSAKHARTHGGAATRTARKGGGKKKKAA